MSVGVLSLRAAALLAVATPLAAAWIGRGDYDVSVLRHSAMARDTGTGGPGAEGGGAYWAC